MTVWHAACTCKMGRTDDPDAVVDSKARVIGVTGLRVVDASSFALLPPGHPQVCALLPSFLEVFQGARLTFFVTEHRVCVGGEDCG